MGGSECHKMGLPRCKCRNAITRRVKCTRLYSCVYYAKIDAGRVIQ